MQIISVITQLFLPSIQDLSLLAYIMAPVISAVIGFRLHGIARKALEKKLN